MMQQEKKQTNEPIFTIPKQQKRMGRAPVKH